MEWKEVRIRDIVVSKNGVQTGPFGTQLHQKDYVEIGTPIITVEHLSELKILHTNLPKVTDKDKLRLKKYSLQKGDIVFSRVGSVDRSAFVSEKEDGWLFSGRCLRIRVNNNIVASYFLACLFNSEYFKGYVRNSAVGATMPSLNTSIMQNLKLHLPPLPIQKKIAQILSAYDDLIENNNRRIELLEKTAQNIYKEWFVRFRFPNYKNTKFINGLPEGWKIKKLEEALSIVKRKPKVKKDKYKSKGKFPIIDQGEKFIAGYTDDERYIQKSPLPIIIFGDHTRRLKFVDFPFAAGADGTQFLYPKNKNLLPAYFYYSVKDIDLSNYAYARHFKFLKSEKFLIPVNEILEPFNKIISLNIKEKSKLSEKNNLLRTARNRLLLKLISGKLSVEHLV